MIHDAFQNYEGESLVIFMPSREWKIDINNKLASMHFFFFCKELLENAHHQSKKRNQQRESGILDTELTQERLRAAPEHRERRYQENICAPDLEDGQFRSVSVTWGCHHLLTYYYWWSMNSA